MGTDHIDRLGAICCIHKPELPLINRLGCCARCRKVRPVFGRDGHLSTEAQLHIHFVTEIMATMMETAIFAYLGLFLFSHRYHWNVWHSILAIFACGASRAVMIPAMSFFAMLQGLQTLCRAKGETRTFRKAAATYIDSISNT